MSLLADPQVWISLLTLTALEIVLGIDNIVFISLITGKLPPEQAEKARKMGILLALVFRILLLMSISWIMGLQEAVFTVFGHGVSWKDIILIGGGAFLIAKAVMHIHEEVEEAGQHAPRAAKVFSVAVSQIIMIDIIFSLDSIITAVGLVDHIEIMVAAVLISVAVMWVAATPIAGFINAHPTTKVLALSFLIMVGFALVADGAGFHVPRGYIYVSMAFAAGVEVINILIRRKKEKRAVPHAATE